jgi:hypothetical protein
MLLAQNFDQFNPLIISGSQRADTFRTPGGIISVFLMNYAFPFAGLVLFAMILWGGFEMMTSSVSGKKDAGRERVTTAVIGFILLFCSYWIAQIVQVLLGVNFL